MAEATGTEQPTTTHRSNAMAAAAPQVERFIP